MHGDVTRTVYVIGETFSTVDWLLQEIREKKFWDLSWKIRMVEPHVRVLGADAGLVSFRLVGEEAIRALRRRRRVGPRASRRAVVVAKSYASSGATRSPECGIENGAESTV
jgi:hypothetical protein